MAYSSEKALTVLRNLLAETRKADRHGYVAERLQVLLRDYHAWLAKEGKNRSPREKDILLGGFLQTINEARKAGLQETALVLVALAKSEKLHCN